jgi:hypothetical protein
MAPAALLQHLRPPPRFERRAVVDVRQVVHLGAWRPGVERVVERDPQRRARRAYVSGRARVAACGKGPARQHLSGSVHGRRRSREGPGRRVPCTDGSEESTGGVSWRPRSAKGSRYLCPHELGSVERGETRFKFRGAGAPPPRRGGLLGRHTMESELVVDVGNLRARSTSQGGACGRLQDQVRAP